MFESIPPNRSDRWKILEAFIAQWFNRPLGPEDGYGHAELDAIQTELGFTLPKALIEWYSLAGHRFDVWSVQDRFIEPHNLELNNGYLNIYDEAEHVTHWGIKSSDLGNVDPPVFQHPAIASAASEVLANKTVSEFALQICVFNSKFAQLKGVTVQGYTDKDEAEVIKLIEQHLKPLAFPYWDWALPRFFGNNNTILEYEQCGFLYCSVQNETQLIEMKSRLAAIDFSWEPLRSQ
jgi:hypothetical protein